MKYSSFSSSSTARRRHPNSIVRLRGKRGWTLKQLAAKSRLNEETIRALELGLSEMHAGHIRRLSLTFDVGAAELLTPCISSRRPQVAMARARANLQAGRGKTRWAGRIPIPARAHPLVRELFRIANSKKVMLADLASESGVSRSTISDWRYRRSPSLVVFEAVLGALGYELRICPKDSE